jgi:hypothetical protein
VRTGQPAQPRESTGQPGRRDDGSYVVAAIARCLYMKRGIPSLPMDHATPKELRAAEVAHALARAVRSGEVDPVDAARILKHELRRLNTNRSHKLAIRSHAAQASIEKHAPSRPPRNDSGDALHSDHVYPFRPALLYTVKTSEAWVHELRRLATVVCVTAKENYALEQVEKTGVHGPEKYPAAGVTFVTPVPW